MRLLHYSKKPFTGAVEPRADQVPGRKPRGFWVSVEGEDDWPSWCRAESCFLERLTYVSEIELHKDARILTGHPEMIQHRYGMGRSQHDWIDWAWVAKEYDGVIIAPYCWDSRMEVPFYYGWDCASGCIWNPSAIDAIRILEGVEA